jgi:chromate transport protein ChrA
VPTERQFLDAVAVAMITPGPVVITVAFIGYLVAGPSAVGRRHRGVPPVLPARRHSRALLPALGPRPGVKAFVEGVTAAAAGAIGGAAFVLGRRAISTSRPRSSPSPRSWCYAGQGRVRAILILGAASSASQSRLRRSL